MKYNGTTVPNYRDNTYDTSEVSRYPVSSGGDIEVEALNVTENGIYTAQEGTAYSPVTVNVSGGSSDFSTAQVTIINNHSSGIGFRIPTYYEADLLYPAEAIFETRIEQSQTKNVPTILYKNRATGLLYNIEDATYACTGGVTDDGDGYVVVSGDGTITIS